LGAGGGVFGFQGCAWGGAEGTQGLRAPALIVVVLGKGLGLCGIEVGTLVEVVGEGFLGGLFWFATAEIHSEVGVGWPPGRMEEWW